MSNIHPDICCRGCQTYSKKGVVYSYDFECADCKARYAIDMIERLSFSKEDAERTKDALYNLLVKSK